MIHDQFLSSGPDPLIMYEISSDQDRYLKVSGVPTWVRQLCCLVILHLVHKLDRPMCDGFYSGVWCCACKLIDGSNTIIVQMDLISLF